MVIYGVTGGWDRNSRNLQPSSAIIKPRVIPLLSAQNQWRQIVKDGYSSLQKDYAQGSGAGPEGHTHVELTADTWYSVILDTEIFKVKDRYTVLTNWSKPTIKRY